jgi:NAD(P)-dependent dehydrogenase (short-subunit alcohol dehydrogenase family)
LVLVTGAAGGLGLAIGRAFAREGAELILTDVDAPGLEATAAALRDEGAQVATHVVDLASEAAIQAFGAQVCAAHGKLHVLVNNAGIAYGGILVWFETLKLEKWLKFLTVNSLAPLMLAQALRQPLAAAKGVILNQSSVASYTPDKAYAVTKATLNAVTYGMAQAFGADGIRVNAIAPGIMETPASVAGVPAEIYKGLQDNQMLKGLHGTAEDIANLAVFLASDEARFITGEIVACDAGSLRRGWRN